MNLESVRVASPCPIDWESMIGTDEVRFCSYCQLNVYNLSTLTTVEAEALLANTEGRLCVRLYRRSNGTVVTQDCPVGIRAFKRRLSRLATAAVGLIASLYLPVVGRGSTKQEQRPCKSDVTIERQELKDQEHSVVSGIVTDPACAVIAGANVGLTNQQTKESLVTRTDDQGRFNFSSVAPGEYLIRIESPGFVSYQIENLRIDPKQITDIRVTLQLKAPTELIGVVAGDEHFISPSTRIDSELIRQLPLP
jgi:carboxypeptidase family protein